jgi:hypothetical protein
MSIYDALAKSQFREIRQASRFDYLRSITLEQLTQGKIIKISSDLKKRSMLPMSELSVPYDSKYCKRSQALISRYQLIKPISLKIDTEKAVYHKAEDIYQDGRINNWML